MKTKLNPKKQKSKKSRTTGPNNSKKSPNSKTNESLKSSLLRSPPHSLRSKSQTKKKKRKIEKKEDSLDFSSPVKKKTSESSINNLAERISIAINETLKNEHYYSILKNQLSSNSNRISLLLSLSAILYKYKYKYKYTTGQNNQKSQKRQTPDITPLAGQMSSQFTSSSKSTTNSKNNQTRKLPIPNMFHLLSIIRMPELESNYVAVVTSLLNKSFYYLQQENKIALGFLLLVVLRFLLLQRSTDSNGDNSLRAGDPKYSDSNNDTHKEDPMNMFDFYSYSNNEYTNASNPFLDRKEDTKTVNEYEDIVDAENDYNIYAQKENLECNLKQELNNLTITHNARGPIITHNDTNGIPEARAIQTKTAPLSQNTRESNSIEENTINNDSSEDPTRDNSFLMETFYNKSARNTPSNILLIKSKRKMNTLQTHKISHPNPTL